MTIKLAILKSGENLISDFKEGFLGEKLVCYLLEKPCSVFINGTYKIMDEEDGGNRVSISLKTWPSFSKQTTIELPPDWIVTLVDPTDELKEMYENQVLGICKNEDNQNTSTDKQSDSDNSD